MRNGESTDSLELNENGIRSDENKEGVTFRGGYSWWGIGGIWIVIMKSVSLHHGGARTHFSPFSNVLSILRTFSLLEKRMWNDECLTLKPLWWTAEVLDSVVKENGSPRHFNTYNHSLRSAKTGNILHLEIPILRRSETHKRAVSSICSKSRVFTLSDLLILESGETNAKGEFFIRKLVSR